MIWTRTICGLNKKNIVAIGYGCTTRFVTAYILSAIETRYLEKFQPFSLKTKRLDRRTEEQTSGQSDMAGSNQLVMLIKIYIYIYFMGSETSPLLRCKLLNEINIPSARV